MDGDYKKEGIKMDNKDINMTLWIKEGVITMPTQEGNNENMKIITLKEWPESLEEAYFIMQNAGRENSVFMAMLERLKKMVVSVIPYKVEIVPKEEPKDETPPCAKPQIYQYAKPRKDVQHRPGHRTKSGFPDFHGDLKTRWMGKWGQYVYPLLLEELRIRVSEPKNLRKLFREVRSYYGIKQLKEDHHTDVMMLVHLKHLEERKIIFISGRGKDRMVYPGTKYDTPL